MDNELVERGERMTFNREIIKKRGVIRAKYWSWCEPRVGLITFASAGLIKALFLTSVNTAAAYFNIKIEEVQAGLWKILYSSDLEHFYRIEGGEPEEDIDLETAVRKLFEEAEENGDNESGTDSGNGNL